MNILVINCGSSSLKYQLIDMAKEEVLAKGLVERIGIEGSVIKHETMGKEEVKIQEEMKDHKRALELVLSSLTNKDYGAVESLDAIDAVGHRVVHGGEAFADSVIINDEVMKAINDNVEIAPLHNPPNIMGIEACSELMKRMYLKLLFLTQPSTKPCQKRTTSMDFPMNAMKNTRFAVTVSTELATSILQKRQLNS